MLKLFEMIWLKTDRIDFDEILRKMQSQKHMSADIVLMSDYSEINNQRVTVCLHTPGHIGRYLPNNIFVLIYIVISLRDITVNSDFRKKTASC